MTFRTIPIDGVLELVSRPIALSIAQTLAARMNITAADQPQIYFNFNGNSVPMEGSAENTLRQDRGLRLENTTSIEITHEEQPTQWAANTVKASSADSQYLFNDAHLEVYVKPVYIPQEARLTIKVKGKSRESTMRAYRYLAMQLYNSVNGDTHETAYKYIIPNYVMQALIEVAKKRERIAGYGQSINQYLMKNFHPAVDVVVDEAAKRPAFVMRENGILVIGEYTHNADVPKPVKDEGIESWSMSLEYKYYFDKPEYVQIQHPIQVHNQFLGERFIEMRVINNPRTIKATSGTAIDGIGAWKSLAYGEPDKIDFQFRQPFFDDWYIRYHDKQVDPIISILCQITPGDQLNLACLSDVDDFKPRQYLLDYIQALGPRAFLVGQGLVRVVAYRGSFVIDPSTLIIDENLNVSSTEPLSLRDQFHLTINLVKDFNVLDSMYWNELVDHIEFFKSWVSLYYPSLYHFFVDSNPDGSFGLFELRNLIANIASNGAPTRTVNNFSLVADSV